MGNTAAKEANAQPRLAGISLEVAQECALERHEEFSDEQILHLALNGATPDITSQAAEILFDKFEAYGKTATCERHSLSQIISLLVESDVGEIYHAKALDLFKDADLKNETQVPAVDWLTFLKALKLTTHEIAMSAFDHVYGRKLLSRTGWFQVAKTFGGMLAAQKALELMLGDCGEDKNAGPYPRVSEMLNLPWSKFEPKNQIMLVKYFEAITRRENEDLEKAKSLVTNVEAKKGLMQMLYRQIDKNQLVNLLDLPVPAPYIPSPGEENLK